MAGFADYGATWDEDLPGEGLADAGEVYAIYILKAYYGQGMGCALMRETLKA